MNRNLKLICLLVAAMCAVGCRQDMADQPSYRPLQQSEFFEDQAASRPLVAGTVPRGAQFLKEDKHLYEGKIGALFAPDFPFPVTEEVLNRGELRYNQYCYMCHGYTGYGDGMIVQRGFSPPPSFHDEVTRRKPVGYYFSVVSNGFGAMGNYSSSLSVEDRWATVAYIRALQHSQNVKLDELPADKRQEIEAGLKKSEMKAPATGGHGSEAGGHK